MALKSKEIRAIARVEVPVESSFPRVRTKLAASALRVALVSFEVRLSADAS